MNTRIILNLILVMLFLFAGCNSSKVIYTQDEEAIYAKPTIAVSRFDVRAVTNTRWNIGDGIADLVADRLVDTRRFMVLERDELEAMLADMARSSKLRSGQGGTAGRLKNVRFLIKGDITDFGQMQDEGWFSSKSYTVVAAKIEVVDVQTGRTIASRDVVARVKNKKDSEQAVAIETAAFGSLSFYQTSIGQATSQMADKAVEAIVESIDDEPFQPKIASVVDGSIVINAGKDHLIQKNAVYIVRPEPEPVRDPDSGDILSYVAGSKIGIIRVTQVMERISLAKVVDGSGFQAGQTLFLDSGGEAGQVAPVVQSH